MRVYNEESSGMLAIKCKAMHFGPFGCRVALDGWSTSHHREGLWTDGM